MVWGNATFTPCIIIGAVTMKMMRRTNITSTRGVTFMSDIKGLLLLPIAMSATCLSYHKFSLNKV